MSKIKIPFNEWSRDKLKRKIKESTCRTYRMGKHGDFFTVGITQFVLEDVLSCKLWIVAEQFFKEEGCKSKEEFIQVWESLHPHAGYQPNQNVYLHFFKEVVQAS